ncbi:MAG: hypothetical protein ACRCST_09265 [Turicibacter sp.]
MNNVKIATLICTFNPNYYLVEQIRSIKNSFFNMPIYISDDSKNGMYLDELEKCYCSDFTNCRVLKGPSLGFAGANFITALKRIFACNSYDWVFLSDQDDLWVKEKVERYIFVANSLDNSIPQIIFSDSLLVDECNQVFNKSFFKFQKLSTSVFEGDDILFKNCVQGATLCINKKMVELIDEFSCDDDLGHIVMHDWWIAILARYRGGWTFINEPLLRYRQHNDNVIGARRSSFFMIDVLFSPRRYLRRIYDLSLQLDLFFSKGLSLYPQKRLKIGLLSRCKLLLIRLLNG